MAPVRLHHFTGKHAPRLAVYVHHTSGIFTNGECALSRPKTENSVRLVSVPQEAIDLLIQEHNKHPDSPCLFPSPITGEMYHPDSVVNIHKKF